MILPFVEGEPPGGDAWFAAAFQCQAGAVVSADPAVNMEIEGREEAVGLAFQLDFNP